MIVLVSLTRKGRAIMLTMASNSFYSSPSSLPINNKPQFLQTPQHTFFTRTYPTLYLKQKQFSTSGTHSSYLQFSILSIALSIDSNCFRYTCFRFCRYYSNLAFPHLPFKVFKNKTLFLGFNFKFQVQSPISILILFGYREGRKRLKK